MFTVKSVLKQFSFAVKQGCDAVCSIVVEALFQSKGRIGRVSKSCNCLWFILKAIAIYVSACGYVGAYC